MSNKRAVEDARRILSEIEPGSILSIDQSITLEDRTVIIRYIVREKEQVKSSHINCRCDVVEKWIRKPGPVFWSKGNYDLVYMIHFERWDLRKGNQVISSLSDKIVGSIGKDISEFLFGMISNWANEQILKDQAKQTSEPLGSDW